MAAQWRKRALAQRAVYGSLVTALLAWLLAAVTYVTRSAPWLPAILLVVGVVLAGLALILAGTLRRRWHD